MRIPHCPRDLTRKKQGIGPTWGRRVERPRGQKGVQNILQSSSIRFAPLLELITVVLSPACEACYYTHSFFLLAS